VVVKVVNENGVGAIECKIIRQLPLTVTAQCPVEITFQWVKCPRRRGQVFWTGCLIKGGQLKAQSRCMQRLDPNFASGLKVALQPFVPERPDHAIYCIPYRY